MESGDPSLNGPVKDVFETIEKLARSERAERVFVRHVFRFWGGRNEKTDDAPIPREACRGIKQVVAASMLCCFPLFRLMRFCTERHNIR